MSWRSAFLTQARSDNDVRKLLNRGSAANCHQLHYLQMAAEKLAKGFMIRENAIDPPSFTHSAIVRCLQTLKARPDIRRQLGYADASAFAAFINSLLPFATSIERLAPNFAAMTNPNPEYPWQPTPVDDVVAPCEYDFPGFRVGSLDAIRFVALIESLLRVAA